MRLLSGAEIEPLLSGITYADKQRHEFSFDLTVHSIHNFAHPGALDFGGSEYSAALLASIPPGKTNPADKYGWWDLVAGTYLVRFNENPSFPAGTCALIVPHRRLLSAGAAHSPAYGETETTILEVLLQVHVAGLRIKENARISTLLVWSPDPR
jgi:hypothetical protein